MIFEPVAETFFLLPEASMEIILGVLAVCLLGFIVFSIKFSIGAPSVEVIQKENASLATRLKETEESKAREDQLTQDLKDKIVSLEAELASKDKDLDEKIREASDAKQKFATLESKSVAQIERFRELEEQASRSKDDAEKKDAELKRTLDEFKSLELASAQAASGLEALQKERDDLAAKLKDYEEIKSGEGKTEEELKLKLTSLQADLDSRTKELCERKGEVDELKGKLKNIEQVQTQKASQATEDVAHFREDLDREGAELKKALLDLAEVSAESQEYRNKAEALLKENSLLFVRLQETEQVSKSRAQVDEELKKKVASLEAELSSRNKELDTRDEEISVLEEKLNKIEIQSRQEAEKFCGLEEKAAHFKEDLEREDTELQKTLAEVQRLKILFKQSEEQSEVLQKENVSLINRLKKLDESQAHEDQTIQKLAGEISQLKTEREKQASTFKEDLERERAELKKALSEMKRFELACSEVQERAGALQKENVSLTVRLKEFEEAKALEDQVEEGFKEKLVSLELERVSRNKELEDRGEKISGLEKKLSELESQGQAQTKKYQELEKQAVLFKQDLEREDAELKKALAEVVRLEFAHHEDKANADSLQRENDLLSNRLKNLEGFKEAHLPEVQELEKKVTLLEAQLASRDIELDNQDKIITELEEEVEGLEKKLYETGAGKSKSKVSSSEPLLAPERVLSEPPPNPMPVQLESRPVPGPVEPKPSKTHTSALPKKKPREVVPVSSEKMASIQNMLQQTMANHDRRIGDILMSRKLITKENLTKALDYQKKYGGNVTQYLLYFDYIKEQDLAHALAQQFRVPYIPLSAYHIPEEVVSLVPVDIAEKYWVMPVDQNVDSLMVAMIDPLNIDIHKDLQRITGYVVIPFVSIISEIISAHRIYYYKTLTQEQVSKIVHAPLFFIDTGTYLGQDRRKSIRYAAKIDISFIYKGRSIESETIDVSRGGFAFLIKEEMDLDTNLTVDIRLPPEADFEPITVAAQVVRCVPVFPESFQIGVRIAEISKEASEMMISYASTHRE